MSWTQRGVQPRSKWVKPTGVLAAGGVKRGGGNRKHSSDDHLSGVVALRNQCAVAHRVVAVRGAGAAGVERGVDLGGGRSSDNDGTGATVHGRGRCWCLRASGDVLSTMGCSDVSSAGSSHGGFMNGGEELSGPAETAARVGEQHGEKRGTGQRLTAIRWRSTAWSGRSWSKQIDGGGHRCRSLKMTKMPTTKGSRSRGRWLVDVW